MKIIIKLKYLFLLFFFLFALLSNYYLGSRNIQNAANDNFNGGICYACQSCKDVYEICQKRFGFDIYNLIYSLIPISFVIALFNNIYLKSNLYRTIKQSILLGMIWLISIEIIVRIFQIPVLYTHFLEGRQSLHYQFFTLFPEFIVIFSIFQSIISGVFGYFVGSITKHFILRKVVK
ncbi:MAG: hypothetical protein ACD_24C00453G0001 [uncultured bacterium]|nr:MAG: hypothetical protein ACD_24C00453G0001 [uncultured bacterium]